MRSYRLVTAILALSAIADVGCGSSTGDSPDPSDAATTMEASPSKTSASEAGPSETGPTDASPAEASLSTDCPAVDDAGALASLTVPADASIVVALAIACLKNACASPFAICEADSSCSPTFYGALTCLECVDTESGGADSAMSAADACFTYVHQSTNPATMGLLACIKIALPVCVP
jgi:hypothetical protein